MANNDYPFHWLHPNVESRATGTHGDGLFAVRAIKAGECVLIFGGYILTVEQESQLAGKLSDNGVQIAKNLVICSSRTEELGGRISSTTVANPMPASRARLPSSPCVTLPKAKRSRSTMRWSCTRPAKARPTGLSACAEPGLAEGSSRKTTGRIQHCKKSIVAISNLTWKRKSPS